MNGLFSLNKINQDLLLAAYGNDIVNVTTGLGYGLALNPSYPVETENFLGSLFFQNYFNTPKTFNGTAWSYQHVDEVPLSKYIKQWQSRLYLGFIKIGSTEYPSRIWYSDLPVNDTIQWGFEYGTDMSIIAGDNRVTTNLAKFKTHNIKRGDPIFILTGANAGQYSVKTIESETALRLADYNGNDITLSTTGSNITYWVGGNWFDVERDDGDYITWVTQNFEQLLIFKRDTVHRYNGTSQSLIKGAPGTTAGRSVINGKDWTAYFHGGLKDQTGFYAYDSTSGRKISNGIQKYIDGINSGMYTNIIGWKEGQLFRWYVGDIDNPDYDLTVSKAVITFDYASQCWSIDPIADVIEAATEFRQGGTKSAFIASDNMVFQTPLGNDFNGSPIPFSFELGGIYPSGTDYSNTFRRIQIISENASGIKILYRRRLKPFDSDIQFKPLGHINGEATWLRFPEEMNQCSGLDLRFQGISTTEPTAVIKKIKLFYVKGTTIING